MGGTLFHSREFTKTEHVGADGETYFEVHCVDGDSLNLSHTSWAKMKEVAAEHGMPHSAWPEFFEYDFGIDVPIEEVIARQAIFRHHLLNLPPEVVAEDYWLSRLVAWVEGGESVFFCAT